MELKELAIAMAKAQAEMSNAVKDVDNTFFKSKYADLAGVREAVMPALNKHGLSVMQMPTSKEDGSIYVKTILMHESGESIDFDGPCVKPEQATAQKIGSLITYLRRYNLMSITGIASDDDDGNAASGKITATPKKEKTEDEKYKLWTQQIFSHTEHKDLLTWKKEQRIIDALQKISNSNPELHTKIQNTIKNQLEKLMPAMEAKRAELQPEGVE